MRQFTVTLAEEEWQWLHSKPRKWLRKVIEDLKWLEDHPTAQPVHPWWAFWRG